jgi:hypothetical protein
MPKSKPRTGEARKVRQPLKIDRLPEAAREAIKVLYDRGRTWVEIAEQSAKPYSAEWAKDGGGFIDWVQVETDALELFPGLRLAKSSLQRWFDLRVSQVRSQVLAESAKAREWAESFAGKDLPGTNAAVMNAMRDQVFTLMQQVGPGDRAAFLDGLNALSLTLARLQRVELQAKRVDVDARKLKLVEEREALARKQLETETAGAASKLSKGELTVADINRLRERVFGLPPVEAPEAAHA